MRWKSAGKGSCMVRYREFDSDLEANAAIDEAKKSFPNDYERFEVLPNRRRGRPYFHVRAHFVKAERFRRGPWQML